MLVYYTEPIGIEVISISTDRLDNSGAPGVIWGCLWAAISFTDALSLLQIYGIISGSFRLLDGVRICKSLFKKKKKKSWYIYCRSPYYPILNIYIYMIEYI